MTRVATRGREWWSGALEVVAAGEMMWVYEQRGSIGGNDETRSDERDKR